ncbi:MAG TPA: L,D-transpeptidase [Polyangiaceae bacterium]|nr:L,D-transpeptidase [Polyangiaceae bacterium]
MLRARLLFSALSLALVGAFACTPWAAPARARVQQWLGNVQKPPHLGAGQVAGVAQLVQRTREHPSLLSDDVSTLSSTQSGAWPTPDDTELEGLDAEIAIPNSGAAQETIEAAHAAAVGRSGYQGPRSTLDPERSLAVIGREAFVHQQPSHRSFKLGYLRAGAIVARSPKPVGTRGCENGWYSIEPEGYVCVGKSATLDVTHPLVAATARRPDRKAALPYAYGISRFPTPPFYTKVPTPKQQRSVEHDLARHLTHGTAKAWQDVPRDVVPDLLQDGQPSYTWGGGLHSPHSVYTGRGLPQSGFAMLAIFDPEDRSFGFSVDLDVMPLDRLKRVEPSTFKGVALDADTPLPLVFVRSKGAFLFSGDPRSTGLKAERGLAYREAIAITGKAVRVGGVRYLQVRGGGYLRDEHLVRINPMKNRPGWATPGRTWLDISILKQTLVAYEGTTPIYATLVSTGADGLGDPKKTHSTVRGQFLVHTKHVTATMSGDVVGDEFDLRDVPYVQYFTEGYALHAAYWHDSFGTPRSHGCINLAPLDANWLFSWTDPPVPDSWHGVMSLRQGTLVHVHP